MLNALRRLFKRPDPEDAGDTSGFGFIADPAPATFEDGYANGDAWSVQCQSPDAWPRLNDSALAELERR